MENIYPNVKQFEGIGGSKGGVMPTQLQKDTLARAGGGDSATLPLLGWNTLNIDGAAPARSLPAGVSLRSAHPAQTAAPAAQSSSECTPGHD